MQPIISIPSPITIDIGEKAHVLYSRSKIFLMIYDDSPMAFCYRATRTTIARNAPGEDEKYWIEAGASF
jgi:hypothetical protein